MIVLRSVAFQLLFLAWTASICLLLLPAVAAPRPAVLALGRLWGRSVLWLLAHVVGLTWESRGRARSAPAAAIYAFKHQSAWETIAISVLLDDPAVVLKRELLSVPLFGWYLRRLRMIAVRRDGGAAALRRMIEAARAEAARGRPIVVFPEGTRTAPGARRPYHHGIAALYRELGAPVVPVALNSGSFWGRRALIKRPGRIAVEFLPPIPAGLSRRAFMTTLEERIETAAGRLAAESGTKIEHIDRSAAGD